MRIGVPIYRSLDSVRDRQRPLNSNPGTLKKKIIKKLFIFGFSYSVYHSVVSEYPCMVIG